MKKLITIVAGVLLVNLSALAQGTIILSNVGAGLVAPVSLNGTAVGGGAPITIELLGGATASSLQPLATTTTWSPGGFFGVGDAAKVLPNLAPGSFPFFQLRAWNNTGGVNTYAGALAAGQAYLSHPLSAPWQLIAGGGLSGLGNPGASPPVPAPALFGMPTGWSLVLVPEPSTILLGVLGAAALLFRRRK
jgi:hypothetical protein